MRFVLVVTGIGAILVAGSVSTGSAAVPTAVPAAVVSPAVGDVVGVGAPVTITFSKPITDKAASERSIHFESPRTPTGAFDWLSDTVVQWTPTGFWPAHSTVNVLGDGFTTSFNTGAATLGVADLDAHTFTVSVDGQVVREMPASMGKPKFATPIGSFTAMSREPVVIMDSSTIGIPRNSSEGYRLTVYNAVRVTSGGVYVHGAPWSVASQGKANVSHGCINLSADNASWYFNMVNIGDPIIVQA